MEILVIDFDKKFEEYMKNWLDTNKDKYSSLDEVEMRMPEIYNQWLNSPADFLSGVKPSDYFAQFQNADDLINLLIRYMSKNIGIPDPLLDAISSKKEASLSMLSEIALEKKEIPNNIDKTALQITALNLIDEINPEGLIADYIKIIQKKDIDEGVADTMIETIKVYAKDYMEAIIDALLSSSNTAIKNRFLDILMNLPYDKRVYDMLITMFKQDKEKALYASYIGKYGNKEACPILINALDWFNINYLDYIEIKNAIEELGEEITHVRQFDGDVYYESMKGMYND
jgi:hypothetical protein